MVCNSITESFFVRTKYFERNFCYLVNYIELFLLNLILVYLKITCFEVFKRLLFLFLYISYNNFYIIFNFRIFYLIFEFLLLLVLVFYINYNNFFCITTNESLANIFFLI